MKGLLQWVLLGVFLGVFLGPLLGFAQDSKSIVEILEAEATEHRIGGRGPIYTNLGQEHFAVACEIVVGSDGKAVKDKAVWVVYWTHVEYGGPSHGTQPSYHLTREEAEAFKKKVEGKFPERDERFFKEGFQHSGSQPTLEFVSKSEYKRIKALGQGGGVLGPSR